MKIWSVCKADTYSSEKSVCFTNITALEKLLIIFQNYSEKHILQWGFKLVIDYRYQI